MTSQFHISNLFVFVTGKGWWILQSERGKDAAAPFPQVQPVVRLSMYSQWSHIHTQYIIQLYRYTRLATQISPDRKHSALTQTSNNTKSLILLPSLAD